MRRPIAILALLAATAWSGETNLVPVVHPDSQVQSITRTDLRRILHAEKRTWEDGQPIKLVLPSEKAEGFETFLRQHYEMDARSLHKLWTLKLYRNEIPSLPTSTTHGVAINIVKRRPGAIAFVPESMVGEDVVVLRVTR